MLCTSRRYDTRTECKVDKQTPGIKVNDYQQLVFVVLSVRSDVQQFTSNRSGEAVKELGFPLPMSNDWMLGGRSVGIIPRPRISDD